MRYAKGSEPIGYIILRGFKLEVQQNSVLTSPQGGEMFIERATAKRFSSLQRSEPEVGVPANVGNIALRWSASYRVQNIISKHVAPLERNEETQ